MLIGNPGEFAILQLPEKMIALTGSKSKLVRKPLPAEDPMQAGHHQGARDPRWSPTGALAEGLRHIIAYLDAEFPAPEPIPA